MADTLFFHYYELTMMSVSCSNMPHLAAHRLPERLPQPSFVQKASARFLAHTSLTQACHSSFKAVILASRQILHSLGFFFPSSSIFFLIFSNFTNSKFKNVCPYSGLTFLTTSRRESLAKRCGNQVCLTHSAQ